MTGRRDGGTWNEAGSATVWVLVASMVLAAGATAAVAVESVAAAHTRAAVAADLAALAGAARWAGGDPVPCAAARRVAEQNGARLHSCTADPDTGVVDVGVEATGRGLLAHAPPAKVRARAGPADRG
jgi:secretion/DNA translocation related TadE-like protein